MIPTLATAPTPCLVLDEARMNRNIARLHARLEGTGVVFRPHLKTAKCIEVARRLMTSPAGPAMVSTLREAEEFAAAGVVDLTYGVGIAPDKLDRVAAIRAGGCDLAVLIDSVEQAEALTRRGDCIPALIEIDCDGHRSGVVPEDAARLLAIARALPPGGPRGVLTHGGESYNARSAAALRAAAEGERLAVVRAAAILREAGFACPVVSAGSTPTFLAAESFEGLTEFRAGVSVFFDLFQAGVGVCGPEEIALSVLTEVIGHQSAKGWTITDAGWMAMSRDRGTASQAVDQGYGVVLDIAGRPLGETIVIAANQEHGIVAARPGSGAPAPAPPIGARLRVLPNHACATAAQYDRYLVVGAETGEIIAEWPRFGGW
ncbi:alanine racemase [Amaricoccus solimangrovi]|uniref:DSD1 family PLP-dependent enzyme n=1 Tax=Amaricoccus solimangrovi TaxID=2589815 RepID=A0A501X0V9_9RHOB|nr:alanine racemase [Amaricoccus solimangrovi]TPE52716.1 DSD1 family PLP-dependent enzyme [Amaricoccus solimangrovi]